MIFLVMILQKVLPNDDSSKNISDDDSSEDPLHKVIVLSYDTSSVDLSTHYYK